MARIIHLMTTNARKFAEYRQRFSQYGVSVIQSPRGEAPEHIEALLSGRGVIAVMRERSNLYDGDGVLLAEKSHLQVALNRTVLQVHTRGEADGVRFDEYVREIEGHIDLTRRVEGQDVFSWDDIFVPGAILHSYHEMRRLGLKLSARDLVIADYVREHLWYKKGSVRLNWTPVENRRSVDFGVDPVAFIRDHGVYKHLPGSHPLRRVLGHTLAEGLFFRSAKNRREKNYWMPGLNAGVPFVPKRDDIHEATFMFHDLMHFAFPDLIFDGASDEASRNTYAVHRMMSEAFTLVLADMVFIDALKGQGVVYDFEKRRIYPLFASLSLDPTDPAQLRALLWANVRYCLAGDVGVYEALGADPEALAAFRGKYEQFFVSDWRWTCQNHRSMCDRLGMRWGAWHDLIAPIRASLPFDMPTVGEYVLGLEADFTDLDSIVEAVFERYWARLQHLMATPPPEDAESLCLGHGFSRYMMGQLAACATYGFVAEGPYYGEQLQGALCGLGARPSLMEVRRLRGFFDQFVDLIWARRLISDDDRAVFKEVYPIFEPFYVAYDVDVTESLEDVARRSMLGPGP